MLDDETVIFLIVLGIAFVVFVIVFNPFFWQAFRNAKYWDDLKRVQDEPSNVGLKEREGTDTDTDSKDIKPWTDSTC